MDAQKSTQCCQPVQCSFEPRARRFDVKRPVIALSLLLASCANRSLLIDEDTAPRPAIEELSEAETGCNQLQVRVLEVAVRGDWAWVASGCNHDWHCTCRNQVEKRYVYRGPGQPPREYKVKTDKCQTLVCNDLGNAKTRETTSNRTTRVFDCAQRGTRPDREQCLTRELEIEKCALNGDGEACAAQVDSAWSQSQALAHPAEDEDSSRVVQ